MLHLRTWTLRLAVAAVCVTLAAAALAWARRLPWARPGLRATYFRNATWSPPAAKSTIDAGPSTLHLIETWGGGPPEVFSVAWTGWIFVLRGGTYTFATTSDDGSKLFVDEGIVVDNGGAHGARAATGSIRLDRGPHRVLIEYFQGGGPFQFEWSWSREGAALTPVPAWRLRPRGMTIAQFVAGAIVDGVAAAAAWTAVALLLLTAIAIAWRIARRLRAWLVHETDWLVLRWIVLGSLALNVAGFWWGLPGTWGPIEVTPGYVVDAVASHFTGGWFEAYPPLHVFLLAGANTPVLLLDAVGQLDVHATVGFTLLLAISRLVSVAAAAGIVIAAGVCGTRAFGRRAGLFAAAIFALVAPFVYYAKTANVDVPYIFWWAASMIFYVRLADRGRVRDYAWFAAFAACAVATKDQAYGLYLFAAPAIVVAIWREHRADGDPGALRATLTDRRLVVAAAIAAVVFVLCDNIIFNFAGFVRHVRFIVTGGSQPYRMFAPTAEGQRQLLALTMHLIRVSFGWPIFLLSLTGLLLALAIRRWRSTAAWLILPLISYYVTFIAVILYNYDRFVLPVCWVLALFAGFAFDAFVGAMRNGRARRLAMGGVAAVFAYTLLYSVPVDLLMIRDSRYAVQAWMAAHVAPGDAVGTAGPQVILPTLDRFNRIPIATIPDLTTIKPAYYVLNADYAHAVSMETDWGQLIAALQHGAVGYHLALRCRRRVPWLPGGHPDLVGPRDAPEELSTLDYINPTIEVFARDSEAAPAATASR